MDNVCTGELAHDEEYLQQCAALSPAIDEAAMRGPDFAFRYATNQDSADSDGDHADCYGIPDAPCATLPLPSVAPLDTATVLTDSAGDCAHSGRAGQVVLVS